MDQPAERSDLVTVTYPDPLFRVVPTFSFDVPPEWVIGEFPDALFVMGPAADAEGSWSNVVVRHEFMPNTTTLESIGKATWKALKSDFPEAAITDQRVIHFETLHYVRSVELTMQDSDELLSRIDSFFFGPKTDSPVVDLFQITFLNPAAAGDPMKLLYLQILKSIRFAEGATEPAPPPA